MGGAVGVEMDGPDGAARIGQVVVADRRRGLDLGFEARNKRTRGRGREGVFEF